MKDISRRLFASSVVGATAMISTPTWAMPFDLSEEIRWWIDSKFSKSVKIGPPWPKGKIATTPNGDPCVAYSVGWAIEPQNTHEQIFEGLKTLNLCADPNSPKNYLAKILSDAPSTATVYWREYPTVTPDTIRDFDGKEYQCEKLYFRMAIE